MTTNRMTSAIQDNNIFNQLQKTGVSLANILQFLTDSELSSLSVNKTLFVSKEVNRDSRWKNRLRTSLSTTLHTQLSLESIRNSVKNEGINTEQETKIINQVFIDLKEKGITQYQSLYARYKKFEFEVKDKLFNYESTELELYPEHLILLSGNFEEIQKYLKKHKNHLLHANPNDKWYLAIIKTIALSGNSDLILLMHDMGLNLGVKDDDNCGLQHWAALSGNPKSIRVCKELKFNMRHLSISRQGVQHFAALSGNRDAVKECVQIGLDMNACDIENRSVPFYAGLSGNPEVILLCHELGLDMKTQSKSGMGVQHAAASVGSKEGLLACRKIKLDMLARDKLEMGIQHHAALSGNCTALLACRDELKLDMTDDKTPYSFGVQHYAGLSGRRAMILLCRDMKLVMTKTSSNGAGVQHMAALSGKREAILACQEINLDMTLELKDVGMGIQHFSALNGKREGMLACHELNLDMKKSLTFTEAGRTINCTGPIQMIATNSGNVEGMLACSELSLDMNDQFESFSREKRVAIPHVAAETGNANLIRLCHDLKLDMTTLDSKGESVQTAAGYSGKADAIQACYEIGMDMKHTNNNGMSVQYKIASHGDMKSMIKCDEIGLDMKALWMGRSTQHAAADWLNEETLLICWASGLDMKAKTEEGDHDIVRIAMASAAINIKLKGELKDHRKHVVALGLHLQMYNNDYRYSSKYLMAWQSNASQGLAKQVISLIDQYLQKRHLKMFKPRYCNEGMIMKGDICANEKHASAESLFLYLAEQMLGMCRNDKFSGKDGLVKRMMFCMKMLYPIMLSEKRINNNSKEINLLMDVYKNLNVNINQLEALKVHHSLTHPMKIILSYFTPNELLINQTMDKIAEEEKGVISKFKLDTFPVLSAKCS